FPRDLRHPLAAEMRERVPAQPRLCVARRHKAPGLAPLEIAIEPVLSRLAEGRRPALLREQQAAPVLFRLDLGDVRARLLFVEQEGVRYVDPLAGPVAESNLAPVVGSPLRIHEGLDRSCSCPRPRHGRPYPTAVPNDGL